MSILRLVPTVGLFRVVTYRRVVIEVAIARFVLAVVIMTVVMFVAAIPQIWNDRVMTVRRAVRASVDYPDCTVYVMDYKNENNSVYIDCKGFVGRAISGQRPECAYRAGKIVD